VEKLSSLPSSPERDKILEEENARLLDASHRLKIHGIRLIVLLLAILEGCRKQAERDIRLWDKSNNFTSIHYNTNKNQSSSSFPNNSTELVEVTHENALVPFHSAAIPIHARHSTPPDSPEDMIPPHHRNHLALVPLSRMEVDDMEDSGDDEEDRDVALDEENADEELDESMESVQSRYSQALMISPSTSPSHTDAPGFLNQPTPPASPSQDSLGSSHSFNHIQLSRHEYRHVRLNFKK
jgi:hypothetical protein